MFKIACIGYVEKDSGSVTGANYLILEELLNRGFEIDFFSSDKAQKIDGLLDKKGMHFLQFPSESFLRNSIKKYLPEKYHEIFDKNLGALIENLFSKYRDRHAHHQFTLSKHRSRHYDLVLFLGLYAPFKVGDVPVVSWVQGPPQTEWEHIYRLKGNIIKWCGRYTYYKMAIFYAMKNKFTSAAIKCSDFFICGSQWSRQQLIRYGIPEDTVYVLPYPMDINFFRPYQNPDSPKTHACKTFLWLGRIDPRKRFDLLIEAFSLLLQERQDVQLKIFGKFRYPGYRQLLDQFPFPAHLEYHSHISRSNIPDLIRSCEIMIQPSEGENFGSSVAEALCCGVPSILGKTNGTQEFTGYSAFMFDEYTPLALKDTMAKALEIIESSRHKISQEARKTAEENFEIHQVIDKLIFILEKAISRETSGNLRKTSID